MVAPDAPAAGLPALPPLPPFTERPVPPAVRELLASLIAEINVRRAETRERCGKDAEDKDWLRPLTSEALEATLAGMAQPWPVTADFQPPLIEHFPGWDMPRQFEAIAALPDLTLPQMVRLLLQCQQLGAELQTNGKWRAFVYDGAWELLALYRQHHPAAGGLREIAACLAQHGIAPDLLGWEVLLLPMDGWEPAALWPYFTEHPGPLRALLGLERWPGHIGELRLSQRASELFPFFWHLPVLPAEFVEPLWQYALGDAKTLRPLAKRALAHAPDPRPRLLATLAGKSADLRAFAAAWLGELGDAALIPVLRQALAKERHEAAKCALMVALERLGVPADSFLDRDALAAEAATQLAKGAPKALAWFAFDRLPALHWADTGAALDPAIAHA